MSKAKTSDRFWKFAKQEKNLCRYNRIEKEIKKAFETKTGLSSTIITKALSCTPHFIGCFAENEVEKLVFGSLPCFMIVNLDSSYMKGSHWISIGIFSDKIEIFDSLGFDLLNWPRIPMRLLRFLRKLAIVKPVYVSKRLQSDNSTLCGLYAIFYVRYRQKFSFPYLQQLFTLNFPLNDKFLIKLFK